jgi:hypothetical protein
MRAFFSGQDNNDEQGLKIYGVIGSLGKMPTLQLRAGVYGYFHPLRWSDVFSGDLRGVYELGGEDDITYD